MQTEPPKQPRASEKFELEQARRLTNLQNVTTADAFARFSSAVDEKGNLSRTAYTAAFASLIDDARENASGEEERARAHAIVGRIFCAYDPQNTGAIRFRDLAGGLTTLCKGPRDDKVSHAFALYGTALSQRQFARLLASVYTLVYATSSDPRERLGVGPEELAVSTAAQAFLDAELDADGRMDLPELRKWYTKGSE